MLSRREACAAALAFVLCRGPARACEEASPAPKDSGPPESGGVVCFGDSTTAPRGGVKVYADLVEERLRGTGTSVPVHNAGVPGNTTVQALARLQGDVLDRQPRVVVMQFGINDSAVDVWKDPPATKSRVPLDDYLKNCRAMIAGSRKAGAEVILMTANPLRWSARTRELYGKPPYDPAAEDGFESPRLLAYNAALRDLAAELEAPLVDVHAAYPGYAAEQGLSLDDMLPDGMHPGDHGHRLVARLLVPAIRELLR